MEKQFEHKRKEPCNICKKVIDTTKDEWATVIDFAKKKQTSIKFYHRSCLVDLVTGQGEIIKDRFREKLQAFVRESVGNPSQLRTNLRKLTQ